MARPQKLGLSYFPFETDFFKKRSMKLLLKSQGSMGILLYIYIICDIYYECGYYVELDEEDIEMICYDLDMMISKFDEIIDYCIKRGIFDKELWINKRILTSKHIQEVYQKAKVNAGRQTPISVESELWLLPSQKTANHINVESNNICYNEDSSEYNCDNIDIYPQSKIKENKLYESKPQPKVVDFFKEKFGEVDLEQQSKVIMYSDNGVPDSLFEYAIAEAQKRGKGANYALAIIEDRTNNARFNLKKLFKKSDASYDLEEFEKIAWNVPK